MFSAPEMIYLTFKRLSRYIFTLKISRIITDTLSLGKIHKSHPMDPKGNRMEPKSHPMDPKSHPMDLKSYPMDPKCHLIDHKSHPIDLKSHLMDPKSHRMDPKSHRMDQKSHLMDLKSHSMEPKSQPMDPKSPCMCHNKKKAKTQFDNSLVEIKFYLCHPHKYYHAAKQVSGAVQSSAVL